MDAIEIAGLTLLVVAGGGLAWGRRRLADLNGRLGDARNDLGRLRDGLRAAVDDRDLTVRRVKEQSDAHRRFAHEPVVADLLEVVDNFERALAAQSEEMPPEHLAGIRMIHGQLLAVLQRHGVERVASVGLPFDPAMHEAVATEPSLVHAEHTVICEWGGGYRLHDRLLRPAKVVLAVRPEAPTEPVGRGEAVATERSTASEE